MGVLTLCHWTTVPSRYYPLSLVTPTQYTCCLLSKCGSSASTWTLYVDGRRAAVASDVSSELSEWLTFGPWALNVDCVEMRWGICFDSFQLPPAMTPTNSWLYQLRPLTRMNSDQWLQQTVDRMNSDYWPVWIPSNDPYDSVLLSNGCRYPAPTQEKRSISIGIGR